MEDKKIQFQIKGTPLIKFQSEERLLSFRSGHLYAKRMSYYRQLEENTGDDTVGDSFEGMLHVNEGSIRFHETGETIALKDALVPTANSDDCVFCMFGFPYGKDKHSFTEKQKEEMRKFGDMALVITDENEFVKRVEIAAKKAGFTAHYDAVKYYDPSIDYVNIILSALQGNWNLAFWKRKNYEYQQEVRFVFSPDVEDFSKDIDHIILDIGDISDISWILPSQYVLGGTLTKNS